MRSRDVGATEPFFWASWCVIGDAVKPKVVSRGRVAAAAPVLGAVLPTEAICYSVSGPRSSFFQDAAVRRSPPPTSVNIISQALTSLQRLKLMANKIVWLRPSHAGPTHQELSLKPRNIAKGKEGKKEANMEGGCEWGGAHLVMTPVSVCVCLCLFFLSLPIPLASSSFSTSPATFPLPPCPPLPPSLPPSLSEEREQ